MMTGLGGMQAICIGVLDFADFIPKTVDVPLKWFFAVPPILWLMALYLCLKVPQDRWNGSAAESAQ